MVPSRPPQRLHERRRSIRAQAVRTIGSVGIVLSSSASFLSDSPGFSGPERAATNIVRRSSSCPSSGTPDFSELGGASADSPRLCPVPGLLTSAQNTTTQSTKAKTSVPTTITARSPADSWNLVDSCSSELSVVVRVPDVPEPAVVARVRPGVRGCVSRLERSLATQRMGIMGAIPRSEKPEAVSAWPSMSLDLLHVYPLWRRPFHILSTMCTFEWCIPIE